MSKRLLPQDYTQLPASFYTKVEAEPQHNAKLLIQNTAILQQLDCDLNEAEILDLASGKLKLFAAEPIAQKYVGHQFGYFNPDLGDGRGLLLGQWYDADQQAWDFHLKGAGRTPYSRRGDGRAVLRSTLREFLASEALAGLGVPTTRALAIASSDEPVQREILEPRASLIRVSPTHIRFGHFEWAASQSPSTLETLLQFVVQKHFPQWSAASRSEQACYFFENVCVKTAELLAKWQAVGFNHGVMNTDNMSILGETFDFGPFAFFDDFNANFVCNHSDHDGRYGYNQQAKIAMWNCQVLAASLSGLVADADLQKNLQLFVEVYNRQYLMEMVQRLGLSELQINDKDLIGDLLVLMDKYSVDYNLFFRRLATWQTDEEPQLLELLSTPKAFNAWFDRFEKRLKEEGIEESVWRQRIVHNNPSVVLRNYIAQEIIEAVEQGDVEPLHRWLEALQSPFAEHLDLLAYQQPPAVAQKGFQLSCSS